MVKHRTVVVLGEWRQKKLGRGLKRLSKIIEMFYILMNVWITSLDTLVKIHHNAPSKWVNVMVYQSHFNKPD